MQMTSYLDTNIISIRETFSAILVKIWRRDVTWRHFPNLGVKSADVIKNLAGWGANSSFSEKGKVIHLKWGVNHISTICGSKVIAISVCGRIYDDVIMILLTSAEIMTSQQRWSCISKVLVVLYNRAKFHFSSASLTLFSKGAEFPPPCVT